MSDFKDLIGQIAGGGKRDPRASTLWTTPIAWRDHEGVWVGWNGDVWLYRAFPQVPLEWEDASTRLAVAGPLDAALHDIAGLSKDLGNGMASLARQREFHLVSISWDERASVPEGTPPALTDYIEESLAFTVPTRALFLGVKLQSSMRAIVDKEATGLRSLWSGIITAATQTFAGPLGEGVPDMTPYEDDRARITRILTKHRATVPTRDQERQLESWFNEGRGPDVEIYRTRDTLIVDRDERIEFGAVLHFEQENMETPDAQWALDAFTHTEGTSIVSIRGELQPNKVARARVRKSIRKLRAQQEEENATSDIDKPEFREAQADAEQVESWVLNSGEPLVVNCSILFGRRVRSENATETYVDELRKRHGMQVKSLEWRQLDALDETLPCSGKRVGKPFVDEFSISTLSYAGLQGFTHLGDPTGVYVGLGDPDWTPVFLNPHGAPLANLPAAMAVLGDSGSGKASCLTSRIPTPDGWTTMGALAVDDEVLGRDGKPYRVTYLSPIETPEMYDVHFSDGQVVTACVDHQWVAASFTGRAAPGKPKRLAAQSNWDEAQATAAALEAAAARVLPGAVLPIVELSDALAKFSDHVPSGKHLGDVLRQEGCTSVVQPAEREFAGRAAAVNMTPSIVFPVSEVLTACRDYWGLQAHGRWMEQSAVRVAICEDLVAKAEPGATDGLTNITRLLLDAQVPTKSGVKVFARQVSAIAEAAGVSGSKGQVAVSYGDVDSYTMTIDRVCWPVAEAMLVLARRIRRQFEIRPSSEVLERVLTTGNMLNEGVHVPGHGGANFAVRLTEALELPEADLPVDPYVLGAWLGDGSSRAGHIASATADSCADATTGLTDQAHMLTQLASAGYAAHPLPSSADTKLTVQGLAGELRTAGVFGNKHIPMEYLRASREQRLALLQGLMDTDGTVDVNGSCELCLCNERLINDALELIRSLGIKASMTDSDAMITEDDPDNPGQKRRRVTGTRWRIHFTTTQDVFRLPRKLARLPVETRATQDWLYITDITPVDTVPARCITVDSPDHTYLIEGFIPTHNTYLLQHLTAQAALAGQKVVFINPKPYDDLSPTADMLRERGVEASVVHLSRLEKQGGFFDPFRFVSATPGMPADEAEDARQRHAAEIATMHITSVMTDLTQRQQLSLAVGMQEGAKAGARCVAEALAHVADRDVAEMVLETAKAYTLFGLGIGLEPQERLGARDGFTLIQFDRKLDLPEESAGGQANYTPSQRHAVAALRLITTASLEMLIGGGGGTLVVDEAHHYLGSEQGRRQLQSLGREGRSQGLLPILATQRISDLVGHELESYISRWWVGKLKDPKEAAAALTLCGLRPTPARIAWIGQCGPKPGVDGGPSQPSQFLHKDLKDRHAAVLIGPTPAFAHDAYSTNPADRAKRAAVAEAEAAAAAESVTDVLGAPVLPTPATPSWVDAPVAAPVEREDDGTPSGWQTVDTSASNDELRQDYRAPEAP